MFTLYRFLIIGKKQKNNIIFLFKYHYAKMTRLISLKKDFKEIKKKS